METIISLLPEEGSSKPKCSINCYHKYATNFSAINWLYPCNILTVNGNGKCKQLGGIELWSLNIKSDSNSHINCVPHHWGRNMQMTMTSIPQTAPTQVPALQKGDQLTESELAITTQCNGSTLIIESTSEVMIIWLAFLNTGSTACKYTNSTWVW